jgi:DNA mismatch repair protein MutS2
MNTLKDDQPLPLKNYKSLDEHSGRLHIENFVLPVESFSIIRQLLVNVRDLHNYFTTDRKVRYKYLYTYGDLLESKPLLLKEIDRVFDEYGEVKSDASAELTQIRKKITSKSMEADKVFRSMLQKFRQSGWLTENEETMRNGRRVLSVPAEHKRKISGIIHDESATGKTVYLEPDAMVQINNDIFTLHIEEKKEIYRILQELTAHFRMESDYLNQCQEVIAHLDFTLAKARLCLKMDAYVPVLQSKPTFNLKNARHPLLLLKNNQDNKVTVPFDLHLIPPNRMLLLSGPNAGGKSITMKATGLLQLMLQSGMPVPVSPQSEMGIFTSFFTDIGDRQSIEEDLSTYSSHLQNMKHLLDHADSGSLMLIDEFGSGTDPKMGGAIAEAILNQFNRQKAWGVITTHYSNLKIFAFNNKGIVNGAMNFDKEQLRPTYQLHIGKPGSSFAFEIATKSGLPDQVLKYARKRAGRRRTKWMNF